jgi:hypothetical protein
LPRFVPADPSIVPANPIEALPIARFLREVWWAYPAVEIVHIAGFVILLGAVVMFDLRVLGLSRTISVRALARHLLPWSWAALLLIVPSGLLMFMARASELLASGAFQLKMGLILLAFGNAAWFLTGPYQSVKQWDVDAAAPALAQVSVVLSLFLWLGVLACGRLLAYL